MLTGIHENQKQNQNLYRRCIIAGRGQSHCFQDFRQSTHEGVVSLLTFHSHLLINSNLITGVHSYSVTLHCFVACACPLFFLLFFFIICICFWFHSFPFCLSKQCFARHLPFCVNSLQPSLITAGFEWLSGTHCFVFRLFHYISLYTMFLCKPLFGLNFVLHLYCLRHFRYKFGFFKHAPSPHSVSNIVLF